MKFFSFFLGLIFSFGILLANETKLESFEKLFWLSNKINGSNYECDGFKYIKNLQKYEKKIERALNEPEKYLNTSPFLSEEKYQNALEYFEYWSLQSIGAFRLYADFLKEKEKALKNANKILKNEIYAKHFIEFFELYAFGRFDNFKNTNKLLKVLKNADALELQSYILKENPDRFELSKALHAGLLWHKDLECLKVLLKYGANLEEGYESAIFYALDYKDGFDFLLLQGVDVNKENPFGKTPIFYAIENNDKKTIEILIKNGADVNKKLVLLSNLDVISTHLPKFIKTCSFIHGRKSVFMHASEFGDEDILNLLIKSGAKYDEIDDLGFNSYDFATIKENKKTLKFLENLGLKSNKNLDSQDLDDMFFDE